MKRQIDIRKPLLKIYNQIQLEDITKLKSLFYVNILHDENLEIKKHAQIVAPSFKEEIIHFPCENPYHDIVDYLCNFTSYLLKKDNTNAFIQFANDLLNHMNLTEPNSFYILHFLDLLSKREIENEKDSTIIQNLATLEIMFCCFIHSTEVLKKIDGDAIYLWITLLVEQRKYPLVTDLIQTCKWLELKSVYDKIFRYLKETIYSY